MVVKVVRLDERRAMQLQEVALLRAVQAPLSQTFPPESTPRNELQNVFPEQFPEQLSG